MLCVVEEVRVSFFSVGTWRKEREREKDELTTTI